MKMKNEDINILKTAAKYMRENPRIVHDKVLNRDREDLRAADDLEILIKRLTDRNPTK